LERKKTKVVMSAVLAIGALAILAAPSIFAIPASFATVARGSGVWTLSNFNGGDITTGNAQYEYSYGSGPITGGITGTTTAALLLDVRTSGAVYFTGQIECVCTVDGKSGILWIAITNGFDVNFNDPNGATTANLVVVGSSGGLAGSTGFGSFSTTTSSDNMYYTIFVHLGHSH
jgi:hypothetical protein